MNHNRTATTPAALQRQIVVSDVRIIRRSPLLATATATIGEFTLHELVFSRNGSEFSIQMPQSRAIRDGKTIRRTLFRCSPQTQRALRDAVALAVYQEIQRGGSANG